MTDSLDVTISRDAQEAQSVRYWAHHIMQLKSGKWAVFDHDNWTLIYIGDDPTSLGAALRPRPREAYWAARVAKSAAKPQGGLSTARSAEDLGL